MRAEARLRIAAVVAMRRIFAFRRIGSERLRGSFVGDIEEPDDFFLKIRVRDMADFNRLHGEQLIALPGMRQTRTFFVMKEVVDNRPLDF